MNSQIPLFPSSFLPENYDAIDISANNVVAFATGNTITLSIISNLKLDQCFTFTIGRNIVTTLKFHPTGKYLLIGDNIGNIFAFNARKRIFIANPYFHGSNFSYVQQIEFYKNGILVLYKSGYLAFFMIFQSQESKTLIFNCAWETSTTHNTKCFTNFSIDPFDKRRIFLYEKNSNLLQMFQINEIHSPAKPISQPLELSDGITILNAQFSFHIQDMVYLVTEDNLMFFHVELSVIIPISHYSRITSALSNIVQFPSDHVKLLLLHRDGSMSLLHLQKPFNFFAANEINHTLQNQELINYCLCPSRDDLLVCVYNPFGITLLDMTTFKTISVIPICFDRTVSICSDGERYVFGSEKGYIITGSVYNINDKSIFKISDEPVTFVSNQSPSKNTLYWSSKGKAGEIDLANHKIMNYKERSLRLTKAIDSPYGALGVIRGVSVIGIFIDGNEQLFTSADQVLDLCFEDSKSNPSSGSVMILTEKRSSYSLIFFNYSNSTGISKIYQKKQIESTSQPTSCSWKGSIYVVGFSDGNIILYHGQNQSNILKISIKNSPIQKLQFSTSNTSTLFALTSDGTIFQIKGQNVTPICEENVDDFLVINGYDQIMCLRNDSSIFFISLIDYKPLYYHLSDSSFGLIPTEKQISINFINQNPVLNVCINKHNLAQNTNILNENDFIMFPLIYSQPHIHKSIYKVNRSIVYCSSQGKDFWQQLLGRSSMFQMFHYASGESSYYENIKCDILLEGNIEQTHAPTLYQNLLYADRIEEAVKILDKVPASSKSYMLVTVEATAAIAFADQGEVTEEQCARLKSAGIALIMNNKTRNGSLLLRIARLDAVAAEYLIQVGKINEAMEFIRTTLSKEEKKDACFMLGKLYLAASKYKKAMMFFLTSEEYLLALYCLYKSRCFFDSFIIKQYLLIKNLIDVDDNEKFKLLGIKVNPNRLCLLIDKHFGSILINRNIDPEIYGIKWPIE